MFDFYQKRKLKTLLNSKYTKGLLLSLALMVGWSAYVRYEIAMEMQGRREMAEQETIELQNRKASLEERVNYLSSERGIEAEMRRQFDVALPGEQVVVIVDEEDDGQVEIKPLASSSSEEEDAKWYQFWR